MTINRKDIVRAVIGFLLFFCIDIIVLYIVKYGFKINVIGNIKYSLYLNLICEFILTVILAIMYRDIIKKGIEKIKEKAPKIKDIIIFLIIGYIAIMAINLLMNCLGNLLGYLFNVDVDISNNQKIINKLIEANPYIMFISAAIFGPIVEELLFRGAIGKIIKNKRVYITVSGLIFGLMHVTESVILLSEIIFIGLIVSVILNSDLPNKKKLTLSLASSIFILMIYADCYYLVYGNIFTAIKGLDPSEIISSFSYIGVGCGLAYIYATDGNIFKNISLHALINTVAFVLLCLS